MRRAALLLLVALLPLAAAAARRSVSETAVPAAKPLDGSEPEGWYLNQTDTFERRSIELTLPDGKTFTLVLPRLLRDNKVKQYVHASVAINTDGSDEPDQCLCTGGVRGTLPP